MLYKYRLAQHAFAACLKPAVAENAFHSVAAAPAIERRARAASTGLKYLFGAGVAWWTATSQSHWQDIQLGVLVPLRLLRDVTTAVAIIADYKFSLQYKDSEGREAALHDCHQRSANRLLQLCFKNGGVYIKLGQHIGQLDHLLPDEYVDIMRAHLLDKCPVSTYEDVRRIIQEDLGKPPEQLYASFEPEPIASASLAQVHVAHTATGRKLAVKVQHAGLREMSAADLFTIDVLVKTVKYVFPDFNYEWLVEEAKQNLPRELDFLHEAQNAERCRANINSRVSSVRGRVKVPEILHDLTSHRVLTMEFVDGVGVTDLEGLQRLHVSRRDVAQLVSRTFNEMIFIHGDVHCDPHAANLKVQRQGDKVQLVLLDHGLYRQLDVDLRHHYAGLWKSLVLADEAGIKEHSRYMNAGSIYPLFAAMLTMKPWNKIVDARADHLDLSNTPEAKREIQEHAQSLMKEVAQLLGAIPRPLILLLKTNDCLRAVDFALGQPANTVMTVARTCNRALAMGELEEQKHNPLATLRVLTQTLLMELHIMCLQLLTWWAQRRHPVSGTGANPQPLPN